MCKPFVFVSLAFFALVLPTAVAVAAQPNSTHSHTEHSSTPAVTSQADSHEADGRIVRIETGSIVLAHDPVPSAGWPAMTMSFDLASSGLAAGLSEGDAVRFRFVEKDGKYIITHLSRIRP